MQLKTYILMLAFACFGCDVLNYSTNDLCGLTPIGWTTTAVVRPTHDGVFGNPAKAWPWVPTVTYTINKSASPVLACTKMGQDKTGAAICTEETPVYVCTPQSESPSTSALLNDLSSPLSTAFSKLTVTPGLP